MGSNIFRTDADGNFQEMKEENFTDTADSEKKG